MTTAKTCGNPQDAETVTLKNDRQVLIRPICKTDDQLEKDLFEHLSAESRRDRFIGGSCKVTTQMLDQLTEHDRRHEAFIAVADVDSGTGKESKAVGVAHYAVDEDGRACECAVVVNDDWQHQGLGRKLMRRLIDTARGNDLDTIYSIDSAENYRYNHLAHGLGFECRVDPHDYTLVTYTLDLNPSPMMERPRGKGAAAGARSRGH